MKKTMFVLILGGIFFLAGISFPLSSSTLVQNTTIFVDDDNTDGPWDGSNMYPFPFIQEAIDASCHGDTIRIADGVYQENILIDKQVTLVGSGIHTTIIDGMKKGSTVTITKDNCTIQHMQLRNCSFTSIEFKQSLLMMYANNSRIEQCLFSMDATDDFFSIAALQIEQGSNNCIISNQFISEDNTSRNHAIYLKGDCKHTQIAENHIIGYDVAFLDSIDSTETSFSNNHIVYNLFGLKVYSSHMMIDHNTISYNRADGIILYNGMNHCIEQNYFEENGCNQGYGGAPAIMMYKKSDNNMITRNHFIHNAGPGVYVYMSHNNRITQNNFIENGWNYDGDQKPNAFYYTHISMIGKTNRWNGNYWYPSSGSWEQIPSELRMFTYFDMVCSVPWFACDWFPSDEPFNDSY